MPGQHWENLKEIFHAALALSPDERAAYLEQACEGNLALRCAVESLIESHEESSNFVDVPAYQAAAEILMEGRQLSKKVRWWPTIGLFLCWARAAWAKFTLLRIPSYIAKYRLSFYQPNWRMIANELRRFEHEVMPN